MLKKEIVVYLKINMLFNKKQKTTDKKQTIYQVNVYYSGKKQQLFSIVVFKMRSNDN